MRIRTCLGILLSVYSLLFLGITSVVATEDATAIMKKVVSRPLGDNTILDVRLTITPSSGQPRVREFKLFGTSEGTDRLSILFFTAPPELVNSGFLSIDYLDPAKGPDKQWLFLSAFQKSKRISGEDRSKRFMGSDFSYYDMSRIDLTAFKYSILEETQRNGKTIWQILGIPVSDESIEQTGYTKSVYWVQADPYLVVKAVHTLKSGGEKHFQVLETKIQNSVCFVTKSVVKTMRDNEVKQSTELEIKKISFESGLDRSMFTTKRLEEGL